MQQEAIEVCSSSRASFINGAQLTSICQATEAMEKYTIERDIAQYIKKEVQSQKVTVVVTSALT